MRSAKLAIALLFLLTFTYAAFGQTGGTITGLISDPAGAVVANAPVEAKNAATGVVASAATSATGNYVFGALPAGTYEINATVPGFKKYVRTGVTVQQLQTTRVDISLEIGASTESVTVSDDVSLLKTETGDVSHNVTTQLQDELPMGQIGAIRVSTQAVLLDSRRERCLTGAMSINGSPSASERIRIDGLDATYTLGNVYYSFGAPSVDSLSEVAIQTSNYAAEYGQSTGAVLSYTMRSGTNQYHGSAYDYWTNEAFNSYGAYSHTRNKSRINDFGGTAGGPIWIPKVYKGKDKTFFFFSYESRPTTTTNSNNLLTVPTAAYRIGDFSAAAGGDRQQGFGNGSAGPEYHSKLDLRSEVGAAGIRDRFTDYPGCVPEQHDSDRPARLDPVALKVQALIPQPQGPFATGLIQNYVNPYTVKSKDYIPSIKIDHSLSSKIKLSYNWGKTYIATPGPPTNTTIDGFPTLLSNFLLSDWPTTSNRLNYDQTLTPTLLLHLGGSFVKSSLSMPAAITGYDATKELGLTGPFTPLEFPVFTALTGANNTGGSSNLGVSGGIDGEQLTLEEKTNFNANLTWVKNNHTFKFGGEAGIEGYPNSNFIMTNGVFNFSGNETALPGLNFGHDNHGRSGTIGLPYASFLLGAVDNYNVAVPAVAKLGKHQLGFYAQDSWKVTRKLTLDLGLRYDYSTAGKEQYGRYGFFDPKVANTQDGGHPGGVTYGATCGCDNNFFNSYKLGFGPRLGVAYQLTPKTVLRGGAALLIGTTADNGIQTRSVTSSNPQFANLFAEPTMTLATGVPLTSAQIVWPNFDPSHFPVVSPLTPGAPGAAPGHWIDKNAGYPSKSYQWSFGVQREIIRNLVVDVAYVGNRGVWLPSSGAVNYNANTPQSLLAAGLDITTAAARTILAAPINTAAAGTFQNKLPYPGFTGTVAQSLRPFPQFTTAPTALWAPLGDNWYNSLQLKVIKRLSHGLDVSYNFTWSKTLQNGIEAGKRTIFSIGVQTSSSRASTGHWSAISTSPTRRPRLRGLATRS